MYVHVHGEVSVDMHMGSEPKLRTSIANIFRSRNEMQKSWIIYNAVYHI